ncbi:Protein of unknown function, partial [Gryllus bimaculatus]
VALARQCWYLAGASSVSAASHCNLRTAFGRNAPARAACCSALTARGPCKRMVAEGMAAAA